MGKDKGPREAAATATSKPKISLQYRLRIKQRLKVLEYALVHGLKPAGRRFGLDRKTIREWRDRSRAAGVAGLLPRYPTRRARRIAATVVDLIIEARKEHGYGAARTRIWLQRVHKVTVAQGTIQRVVRDQDLPRLGRARKRQPRQLKLFERERPGDCVQVDVKVVRLGRQKYFQYTAIDDCTRFRVLRLYRRQNQLSSLAFLAELRAAFPFPIRRLQTDNGSEFSLTFALSVTEAGITHKYIRPRRPQQNGKVERSHRVDAEEFWGRQELSTFDAALDALRTWERTYNHDRFSMALKGRTPAERLTDFPAAA